MRKIFFATIITLSFAVLASSLPADTKPGLTSDRSFTMKDSLQLYAWISRPMVKAPAPMLVLLPMLGQTHRSYDQFKDEIRDQALSRGEGKIPWPYVVAFDLRGHGRSTERAGSTVDFQKMSDEEYKKMPEDIAAALKEILADSAYNIDTTRIMVVGASIGANTAIMLTEYLPNIEKVAMLSPGEDYHGLVPLPALKAYKGKSTIFASTEDYYANSSAKILSAAVKDRCTLESFYGNQHGTNIIGAHAEAMQMLIDWLFK